MNKYLDLKLIKFTETGKTYILGVYSKSGGYLLGTIKWWGAWRQYVFAPEPEMVFNKECLTDIMIAMNLANQNRSDPKPVLLLNSYEVSNSTTFQVEKL